MKISRNTVVKYNHYKIEEFVIWKFVFFLLYY